MGNTRISLTRELSCRSWPRLVTIIISINITVAIKSSSLIVLLFCQLPFRTKLWAVKSNSLRRILILMDLIIDQLEMYRLSIQCYNRQLSKSIFFGQFLLWTAKFWMSLKSVIVFLRAPDNTISTDVWVWLNSPNPNNTSESEGLKNLIVLWSWVIYFFFIREHQTLYQILCYI